MTPPLGTPRPSRLDVLQVVHFGAVVPIVPGRYVNHLDSLCPPSPTLLRGEQHTRTVESRRRSSWTRRSLSGIRLDSVAASVPSSLSSRLSTATCVEAQKSTRFWRETSCKTSSHRTVVFAGSWRSLQEGKVRSAQRLLHELPLQCRPLAFLGQQEPPLDLFTFYRVKIHLVPVVEELEQRLCLGSGLYSSEPTASFCLYKEYVSRRICTCLCRAFSRALTSCDFRHDQ